MQVVTDFFDEMKSRSKGYASMEYQITGYRPNKLVRLDVKINQEVSDRSHCLQYPVSDRALPTQALHGALHHQCECCAGGRALGIHCAQGQCLQDRPGTGHKAEGTHS